MKSFKIAVGVGLLCAILSGCATAPPEAPKSKVKFTQRGVDVMVTVDNDILFDLGAAALRKEAGPVLDMLVTESLSRTKKDFVVEGHTDVRGSEAFNQKLSDERARSVKGALVARGILSSRIRSVGYGSSQPVVLAAASEEDHQRNRRAVILISNENVDNVRIDPKPEGGTSVFKSLGLK